MESKFQEVWAQIDDPREELMLFKPSVHGLEKGTLLGHEAPAEEIAEGDEVDETGESELVCHLTPVEREQRLKEQLDLESLPPELVTLIKKYADVFALDESELGTTNMVTHVIDTGYHPSIRQPLRRVPFALRSKVDDGMLPQGVLKPSKSP